MTDGYIIVEYNQASGMPSVRDACIYFDRLNAEADAEEMANDAASVGRRERYAVAELYIERDAQ
jgi:hypothetical protein